MQPQRDDIALLALAVFAAAAALLAWLQERKVHSPLRRFLDRHGIL
jgi:hypothetical protein